MLYRQLTMLICSLLLMLTAIPASQAGSVYLGYTLGPASSEHPLVPSPLGRMYFVGYRSDRVWGVEIGRVFLFQTTHLVSGETVVATLDTKFFGTNINATATKSFGPYSVFARAGIIDWEIEVNGIEAASDTDLTYGLGMDYHFNNSGWGLRLEWHRYLDIATADYDVDQYRFGVIYSFK